jgi:serine/threonine-protein kinase
VARQDPSAGTSISKGSTVDIVLTASFRVPEVTGLQLDTAQNILRGENMRTLVTEQFSTDAQKGLVISQDPAGDSFSEPGTTVTLVVGKGVEKVAVPDVVGKTENEAVNALSAAGLKADIQNQSSDTVAQGEVLSQDPAKDTEVAKGSTVTVVVSSGPAKVTVPGVKGQTQASATTTLENAGFVVLVQKVITPNPADQGKVIDQTPPGGTMANKGSNVTIYVGSL